VNFAVRASRNPALALSLVYTQLLFVAFFSVLLGEERLCPHALWGFPREWQEEQKGGNPVQHRLENTTGGCSRHPPRAVDAVSTVKESAPKNHGYGQLL
jgi:hypothetical protein